MRRKKNKLSRAEPARMMDHQAHWFLFRGPPHLLNRAGPHRIGLPISTSATSSHSHIHNFITVVKKGFSTVSSSYSYFLGKAITHSDRTWNSLSFYIFSYCLRPTHWRENLSTTSTSLTDKRHKSSLFNAITVFFYVYYSDEKDF
jgi:hypothetical protein